VCLSFSVCVLVCVSLSVYVSVSVCVSLSECVSVCVLASDVNIEKLVELTDSFSGAEIAAITNRAAITALKRYVSGRSQNVTEIRITQQDLIDAVDKVKPRKKEAPLSQSIK